MDPIGNIVAAAEINDARREIVEEKLKEQTPLNAAHYAVNRFYRDTPLRQPARMPSVLEMISRAQTAEELTKILEMTKRIGTPVQNKIKARWAHAFKVRSAELELPQ